MTADLPTRRLLRHCVDNLLDREHVRFVLRRFDPRPSCCDTLHGSEIVIEDKDGRLALLRSHLAEAALQSKTAAALLIEVFFGAMASESRERKMSSQHRDSLKPAAVAPSSVPAAPARVSVNASENVPVSAETHDDSSSDEESISKQSDCDADSDGELYDRPDLTMDSDDSDSDNDEVISSHRDMLMLEDYYGMSTLHRKFAALRLHMADDCKYALVCAELCLAPLASDTAVMQRAIIPVSLAQSAVPVLLPVMGYLLDTVTHQGGSGMHSLFQQRAHDAAVLRQLRARIEHLLAHLSATPEGAKVMYTSVIDLSDPSSTPETQPHAVLCGHNNSTCATIDALYFAAVLSTRALSGVHADTASQKSIEILRKTDEIVARLMHYLKLHSKNQETQARLLWICGAVLRNFPSLADTSVREWSLGALYDTLGKVSKKSDVATKGAALRACAAILLRSPHSFFNAEFAPFFDKRVLKHLGEPKKQRHCLQIVVDVLRGPSMRSDEIRQQRAFLAAVRLTEQETPQQFLMTIFRAVFVENFRKLFDRDLCPPDLSHVRVMPSRPETPESASQVKVGGCEVVLEEVCAALSGSLFRQSGVLYTWHAVCGMCVYNVVCVCACRAEENEDSGEDAQLGSGSIVSDLPLAPLLVDILGYTASQRADVLAHALFDHLPATQTCIQAAEALTKKAKNAKARMEVDRGSEYCTRLVLSFIRRCLSPESLLRSELTDTQMEPFDLYVQRIVETVTIASTQLYAAADRVNDEKTTDPTLAQFREISAPSDSRLPLLLNKVNERQVTRFRGSSSDGVAGELDTQLTLETVDTETSEYRANFRRINRSAVSTVASRLLTDATKTALLLDPCMLSDATQMSFVGRLLCHRDERVALSAHYAVLRALDESKATKYAETLSAFLTQLSASHLAAILSIASHLLALSYTYSNKYFDVAALICMAHGDLRCRAVGFGLAKNCAALFRQLQRDKVGHRAVRCYGQLKAQLSYSAPSKKEALEKAAIKSAQLSSRLAASFDGDSNDAPPPPYLCVLKEISCSLGTSNDSNGEVWRIAADLLLASPWSDSALQHQNSWNTLCQVWTFLLAVSDVEVTDTEHLARMLHDAFRSWVCEESKSESKLLQFLFVLRAASSKHCPSLVLPALMKAHAKFENETIRDVERDLTMTLEKLRRRAGSMFSRTRRDEFDGVNVDTVMLRYKGQWQRALLRSLRCLAGAPLIYAIYRGNTGVSTDDSATGVSDKSDSTCNRVVQWLLRVLTQAANFAVSDSLESVPMFRLHEADLSTLMAMSKQSSPRAAPSVAMCDTCFGAFGAVETVLESVLFAARRTLGKNTPQILHDAFGVRRAQLEELFHLIFDQLQHTRDTSQLTLQALKSPIVADAAWAALSALLRCDAVFASFGEDSLVFKALLHRHLSVDMSGRASPLDALMTHSDLHAPLTRIVLRHAVRQAARGRAASATRLLLGALESATCAGTREHSLLAMALLAQHYPAYSHRGRVVLAAQARRVLDMFGKGETVHEVFVRRGESFVSQVSALVVELGHVATTPSSDGVMIVDTDGDDHGRCACDTVLLETLGRVQSELCEVLSDDVVAALALPMARVHVRALNGHSGRSVGVAGVTWQPLWRTVLQHAPHATLVDLVTYLATEPVGISEDDTVTDGSTGVESDGEARALTLYSVVYCFLHTHKGATLLPSLLREVSSQHVWSLSMSPLLSETVCHVATHYSEHVHHALHSEDGLCDDVLWLYGACFASQDNWSPRTASLRLRTLAHVLARYNDTGGDENDEESGAVAVATQLRLLRRHQDSAALVQILEDALRCKDNKAVQRMSALLCRMPLSVREVARVCMCVSEALLSVGSGGDDHVIDVLTTLVTVHCRRETSQLVLWAATLLALFRRDCALLHAALECDAPLHETPDLALWLLEAALEAPSVAFCEAMADVCAHAPHQLLLLHLLVAFTCDQREGEVRSFLGLGETAQSNCDLYASMMQVLCEHMEVVDFALLVANTDDAVFAALRRLLLRTEKSKDGAVQYLLHRLCSALGHTRVEVQRLVYRECVRTPWSHVLATVWQLPRVVTVGDDFGAADLQADESTVIDQYRSHVMQHVRALLHKVVHTGTGLSADGDTDAAQIALDANIVLRHNVFTPSPWFDDDEEDTVEEGRLETILNDERLYQAFRRHVSLFKRDNELEFVHAIGVFREEMSQEDSGSMSSALGVARVRKAALQVSERFLRPGAEQRVAIDDSVLLRLTEDLTELQETDDENVTPASVRRLFDPAETSTRRVLLQFLPDFVEY
ncbi:MAG: hypothetical protein MHM6MM_000139 [Cercozoa sp. M6MM]